MTRNTNEEDIPLWLRVACFFEIFALGLLLCIDGIGGFLLYPIGIFATLAYLTGITFSDEDMIAYGYFIYIVLFISFLTVKKSIPFRVLILSMVIITLMNLIGCRMMLSGLSKIGN